MEDKEHLVRQRAHELWETSGRPEGREHDHWAQATREVHEGDGQPAGAEPEAAKPAKKGKAAKTPTGDGRGTAIESVETEAEAAAATKKPAKAAKKKAAGSTAAEAAATEAETASAPKPRKTTKKVVAGA